MPPSSSSCCCMWMAFFACSTASWAMKKTAAVTTRQAPAAPARYVIVGSELEEVIDVEVTFGASPGGPGGPLGPAAPIRPCGPMFPTAPATPFSPCLPRSPLMPGSPFGPALPGGPAERRLRLRRWTSALTFVTSGAAAGFFVVGSAISSSSSSSSRSCEGRLWVPSNVGEGTEASWGFLLLLSLCVLLLLLSLLTWAPSTKALVKAVVGCTVFALAGPASSLRSFSCSSAAIFMVRGARSEGATASCEGMSEGLSDS
mmetsp:Transcript_19674/g.29450  ORF Transcript_19674/g.29450 Transcript_19674/m.29450 type:complete len:258 (-) Transcript_19674:283-1056(-)